MYHNPFGMDDDGFSPFPGQRAARPGAFMRQLRCYPVSFIGRDELERGDKIILPTSALALLTRLNITYPMLFKLESLGGHSTHCGVLEFLAKEGHVYIPYWMMQNLQINEGDMLKVGNAVLEKGNFVKFQPQTEDFLAISNPRSVLERTLRSFTCLSNGTENTLCCGDSKSTGDSIPINYNGKNYWIDVLDVKPGTAVSIIETDVNVDFAPPPGYKEPTAPPKQEGSSSRPGQVIFGEDKVGGKPGIESKGRKLVESSDSESEEEGESKTAQPEQRFPGDGNLLRNPTKGRAFIPTSTEEQKPKEDEQESKPSEAFKAFSGVGQSLRGAKTTGAPSTVVEETQTTENGGEETVEKPKFVPFGGAGRRLRD